ncbi:MAG: glycosyltransferase family 2 protein [Planctomycetota bacterium]|jgi:glycosyltransferase involved in cell wall biosynthesis
MDDTATRPPLTMSLTPDEVELSVIVPLYNEEDSVPALYERLREAADALGRTYELVLVNDGSTDRTGALIKALADEDDRVVAISFPRNFGQTAALLAGFDHARGRVLVPMDGDLQNDPADIRRLLEKLDEGYDVVSGWRKDRRDPWTKVLPSRIANAVISRASGVRLHDYGCSLKAYRREVLEGVDLYGEMHRFVPIYATWRGARVTEIPVTHHPRARGRTKYGLERVFKVLLDLIVVKFLTSYLTKPIYIFGGFGMFNIALSFAALAAAVVFKLVPQDNPWGPGWHKDFVETPLPVVAVGLLLLGIQMILIGLLAEMLMRTYYESQGKRAYIISSIRRRPRAHPYAARRAG